MTDLEKLKHLVKHWIEHNETHVKTYSEWAVRLGESAYRQTGSSKAEKTDSQKMKELSEILEQIADESKKLEELFKKALESI